MGWTEWLGDCKNWPEQPNVTNNDEPKIERKKLKELLATVDLQNPIDTLLNKSASRKVLRILSWVDRFLNKCRKSKLVAH